MTAGTAGFVGLVFANLFAAIGGQTVEIHDMTFTGEHALHYRWNALQWLRVGGDLSYSRLSYTMTNSGDYLFNRMGMQAKIDFTYLNRRYVKLYSGLGLGIGVLWGYEPPIKPMPQFTLTPIGVEAGGDRVYGLAEINIGTTAIFQAGIGVHL